jgi:DNA polymerase-1
MSINKLLLIDTFFFLHRAFHSFPKDFTNSSGLHTNILFGFSKALLDSIAEFNPTHIVCGWESEELPSFRKTLYSDYQKNRIPMELDDERIFSEQIPWVVKILDCFNIPRITHNGFEGDDVLGTVATLASENAEVIIVSSDQDILQLITDKIKVFRPARPPFISKQLFDEVAFEEKYGFKPIQMIDYKALRGDPSDNIPGVKGVGDKTAKELISQFGALENIYENLDEIKSSVRTKLENDKEKAFMSKQLATIITDIPMEFNLESAEVHDFNIEKVQNIFNDLEFFSLKKDLEKLLKIKTVKDKLKENTKEEKQISLF